MRSFSSKLVPAILLAGLVSLQTAQAQQPPEDNTADTPIEPILMRLQIHLWDYESAIPDFFADEHVLSTRTVIHSPAVRTATDSIFRLQRTSEPSIRPPTFTETREIRYVDGAPVHSDSSNSIRGPSIFSGGFSSALSVVSFDLKRCFDYTVVPDQHLHHKPVLTIDYTLKSAFLDDPDCPGPEERSGRAWIDPDTFHVIRLDMKIPHHLTPDGYRVFWQWSIDYAPVTIDNKLFWMPKIIESHAESADGNTLWNFTAWYRNYHKTNVTSRIITNLNETSTQPNPHP